MVSKHDIFQLNCSFNCQSELSRRKLGNNPVKIRQDKTLLFDCSHNMTETAFNILPVSAELFLLSRKQNFTAALCSFKSCSGIILVLVS